MIKKVKKAIIIERGLEFEKEISHFTSLLYNKKGGLIMEKERRFDFCTECRKETEYEIREISEKETIRDKEYVFKFTKAYCKECGEEMSVPGLIDINIRERDEQYRKAEGIIPIEDIKKFMKIYNIGKAPLSLALGFGEVTITRYLEGQMPSKNYSDIMIKALSNPEYMELLLKQNKDRVGETAYKKTIKAIKELKSLFDVSEKMLIIIAYIFEQMQEITPLALQKMLYYIEGIYMVLCHRSLFEEDCVAWQHGPVYEKIYFLFSNFKYNPIEDSRFVLFTGKSQKLSSDERRIIDLVIATFGKYSGKILETITHNERPWQDARKGYGINEPSNVVIEKENINCYFKEVSQKFDIGTIEGLNKYIDSKLAIAG